MENAEFGQWQGHLEGKLVKLLWAVLRMRDNCMSSFAENLRALESVRSPVKLVSTFLFAKAALY